MAEADLATLEGLTEATGGWIGPRSQDEDLGLWEGNYCSACGARRRMHLGRLHYGDSWVAGPARDARTGEPAPPRQPEIKEPSLFVAICLQCESILTLVVYPGPNGPALVALPDTYGGLSTPNTPEGVSYYLDQAQRSQATGASSGAVAMYRAALEQLLHEQGYTSGMLSERITALMNDQQPPAWRDRLGRDYLDVINRLGNAAIHANDGDIGQQAVFDAELLLEVRELFVELLDDIYEQPAKKTARLTRLQQVAASIKRR